MLKLKPNLLIISYKDFGSYLDKKTMSELEIGLKEYLRDWSSIEVVEGCNLEQKYREKIKHMIVCEPSLILCQKDAFLNQDEFDAQVYCSEKRDGKFVKTQLFNFRYSKIAEWIENHLTRLPSEKISFFLWLLSTPSSSGKRMRDYIPKRAFLKHIVSPLYSDLLVFV